jgi:hypothetical protein
MSREVRRVPVGWKHPVTSNPYWREQEHHRLVRGGPQSRLHGLEERFVGLMSRSLSEAQAEWDAGAAAWAALDLAHPDDLVARKPWEYDNGPRPVDGYMPDFDVPLEDLGWCLYETVSEGTPTTPVFATAEELIEHLVTVGEDYDQQPYRREAAERLVAAGSSFGSFVSLSTADGVQVLDGARDLDRIEEVTRHG